MIVTYICESCGHKFSFDLNEQTTTVTQWACGKCGFLNDTKLVDPRKEYENSFPEDARARRFDGGF